MIKFRRDHSSKSIASIWKYILLIGLYLLFNSLDSGPLLVESSKLNIYNDILSIPNIEYIIE